MLTKTVLAVALITLMTINGCVCSMGLSEVFSVNSVVILLHFSNPLGLQMDQATARHLFEVGAMVVLLDVPPGTEIGIDMHSWQTGENFKGIKMIPPGLHYIYFK